MEDKFPRERLGLRFDACSRIGRTSVRPLRDRSRWGLSCSHIGSHHVVTGRVTVVLHPVQPSGNFRRRGVHFAKKSAVNGGVGVRVQAPRRKHLRVDLRDGGEACKTASTRVREEPRLRKGRVQQ